MWSHTHTEGTGEIRISYHPYQFFQMGTLPVKVTIFMSVKINFKVNRKNSVVSFQDLAWIAQEGALSYVKSNIPGKGDRV